MWEREKGERGEKERDRARGRGESQMATDLASKHRRNKKLLLISLLLDSPPLIRDPNRRLIACPLSTGPLEGRFSASAALLALGPEMPCFPQSYIAGTIVCRGCGLLYIYPRFHPPLFLPSPFPFSFPFPFPFLFPLPLSLSLSH